MLDVSHLMTMAMLWFATGDPKPQDLPGSFFQLDPGGRVSRCLYHQFLRSHGGFLWVLAVFHSTIYIYIYIYSSHPINRNGSFDMETDDTPWPLFPHFVWWEGLMKSKNLWMAVEDHRSWSTGVRRLEHVRPVWREHSPRILMQTPAESWRGFFSFDQVGHTGFGLYVFMCFLFLRWLYIWIMLHVIIHISYIYIYYV